MNLSDAAHKLSAVADKAASAPGADALSVVETVVAKCEAMLEEDVQANKVYAEPWLSLDCRCNAWPVIALSMQAMGKYGVEALHKALQARSRSTDKLQILTHCNTGSLATAEYGTALGVIRATAEAGALQHAYCTETRPYNQGQQLNKSLAASPTQASNKVDQTVCKARIHPKIPLSKSSCLPIGIIHLGHSHIRSHACRSKCI